MACLISAVTCSSCWQDRPGVWISQRCSVPSILARLFSSQRSFSASGCRERNGRAYSPRWSRSCCSAYESPKELMMPGRLTDKVAIITGATSGIGKATAILFAAEGAQLVITGRRGALGNALAAQLSAGGRCIFVEADHTHLADCQRVVDETLKAFGRIDVLFNNAGIVTSGTAETTDEQTWNDTLAINVTAVWHMCKLVIPHMKHQGRGVIVNNGSDWSVVAGDGAFPYIVSKGAVGM